MGNFYWIVWRLERYYLPKVELEELLGAQNGLPEAMKEEDLPIQSTRLCILFLEMHSQCLITSVDGVQAKT